jgi:hypothetical protein
MLTKKKKMSKDTCKQRKRTIQKIHDNNRKQCPDAQGLFVFVTVVIIFSASLSAFTVACNSGGGGGIVA